MAFLHGVYGEHSAYAGKKATRANGTIPAYIGTAPIHQLNKENAANFDYSAYINTPIIINSYPDAKEKLGVSSDFETFTLMEAVHAHFMNGDKPIAPIIVVNMAKPDSRETESTEATITLSGVSGNKIGYIDDSAAVIESVAIAGLTAGDYTLSYVEGKIKVTVTKSAFTDGTVAVTYNKIKTDELTLTETNFTEALNALDICEIKTGEIPNLLLAPFYSKNKSFHDLMIAKATSRIANKWYVDVLSDIPADSTTNTVAKAISKKAEMGYNSTIEKVFYPMLKFNGKIYHFSTMAAVRMQQTDTEAGGVPYISPSNKPIYADAAVLADGTQLYINETTANTANANGLTTVNIVRGGLRMWGGSNGNYNYTNESNIDPEHLQDVGVRMKHFVLNKFMYDYMDNIDTPISRRNIDSILSSVQQWLNSLINEGKLLFASVDFIEDNNSVKDMISGDFTFDVSYTHAPNAKSITFKTHYTEEGIATLTAGGAE